MLLVGTTKSIARYRSTYAVARFGEGTLGRVPFFVMAGLNCSATGVATAHKAMTRKRETQAFRDQQADAIERNPSIPCDVCGEEYAYQDYWEDHLDKITPETTWRCKDCLNELIAQAIVEKRKDRNANISDFA